MIYFRRLIGLFSFGRVLSQGLNLLAVYRVQLHKAPVFGVFCYLKQNYWAFSPFFMSGGGVCPR
ncbi:hypothetical protein E3U36_05090 [Arsenophonus endosymbiont of Aphis craccivora]|nr:hypothetical protein E3U36_05090 [Arsenophonus endosymbiont of Aphis craccivora]